MDELQINTLDSVRPDITWPEAYNTVQGLCLKEIVYLDQLAQHHEDEFSDEDYAHGEKAKALRNMAADIRKALVVIGCGV
jgi:hypothetical protein|tara:strand:- start:328 stop:567 length:240 start_codon:yes stop_codon:yes gene_type:complete